jgi:intracellular septation protein A
MSQRDPTSYSARDILGHPRVIDAVLPPIVFVTAYGFVGLVPAAAAAVATSLVMLVVRLRRGEGVAGPLGGILGTSVAVGIALLTGRPENYFIPRTISNAVIGTALLVSILVRRPAVGLIAAALYRLPREWLAQPEVRRVFTIATWPWVGLSALRAAVYLVLIDAGEVGWLAVVTTVLGWPSFAALLIATYAYISRRLEPPQPAPPGPG